MEDTIQLTPWTATGKFTNEKYDKLIKEFGVQPITPDLLDRFKQVTGHEPHVWLKRGIFFAHRDLNILLDKYEGGVPIFIYTGRGPSSDALHLGHVVPFMFTKWLQDVFNATVVIQMADDEKYYFKDMKFNDVYKLGFENAKDIIACGFNPQKTFIFSNRDFTRNQCAQEVIATIWKHMNINKVQAVFGLPENCSVGQLVWPTHQLAAAFSPYYGNYLDPKSYCLVSYAIDQDPYFRMCRDIAHNLKSSTRKSDQPEDLTRDSDQPEGSTHTVLKPSSIITKFLPSLTGDAKMSSTILKHQPDVSIFMTDTPKSIQKKINKYGASGGKDTIELHREFGGDLDIDISYQYLRYFEPNDEKLEQIAKSYSSGEMLTGEIKKIMGTKVIELVKQHQEARSQITDDIMKEFYSM